MITMRKAKEVKVVRRWRTDEFDGEIPIGGDDEEMLGTAMRMAEGVGQIQGIVEDTQPFWAPAVYHAFYTGGGFVTGNALAALLTKDEDRVCPACFEYSFNLKDDLYMNKYDCCWKCYVQFVERREERWIDIDQRVEFLGNFYKGKDNG